MSGARLYLRYFSIQFRSAMQYKSSFFLTLAGQFLSAFTTFLAVYFLMSRFHRIEGFSYAEVLLCFASVLMAFSLAECFARGFDRFSLMLGNGEFDRVLVRPRGVILQVLASKMEFTRLGRLFQAVFVFAWAIPNCGVDWNAPRVVTLALMVTCGAAFFTGMFLIYSGLCFFTTEGLEFINIFTDGGREFGQYPMSVYGDGVLRLTTYVVPLACAQYYPLLYLLGRETGPAYMLSPLAAAAFLLPCYWFFRFGLRHYRSTGS